MTTKYYISLREILKLHKRSFHAQKDDDKEVCGLLLTNSNNKNLKLLFLKNLSIEPGHYEIKLKEIKKLEKEIKLQEEEIIGTFHSHPISEAIPGKSDIQGAYKRITLIYDVIGEEAKLWFIKKRQRRDIPIELPLVVIGGNRIEKHPRKSIISLTTIQRLRLKKAQKKRKTRQIASSLCSSQ